jgi:hypothetical protein
MRKKKHLAERLANCTNVTKLISDDCNVLTAIEKKEYIPIVKNAVFKHFERVLSLSFENASGYSKKK